MKRWAKRAWWFARGRYAAGPLFVDARRWWSPADRRDARLSAQITAVVYARHARELEREMTRRLLFGYSMRKFVNTNVQDVGGVLDEEMFFRTIEIIRRDRGEPD